MDTLDITEIQVEAAKLANQIFFWRLILDDGKVVDQYDPITGIAQQFPNWVHWVDKPVTDLYAGQPAFKGIKVAFWIPIFAGASAYHVEGAGCHSVILFRKNYTRDVGGKYTVYCIGRRWEGDKVTEEVHHICPPARYLKTDGTHMIFKGSVSTVTDPLGKNAFDLFLEQIKKDV